MDIKRIPYLLWTFTISFILITFLPRSLDDTMFMDGMAYASIARNMAIGKGSFWQPYFADSFWLPYDNDGFFHGHPPLQFGLESLLFRVLGDSTAVENIYNLLVLIASVVLIAAIWKKFFTDKDIRAQSWLPVLCWYSMLIVWYAIPNHFLDSTMAVFCLLSCYFQLKALSEDVKFGTRNLFLVLAGISIFLAVLTKGPVGLYPLAFSGIYLLFQPRKSFSTFISATAILLASFAVPLALLLTYDPARVFLSKYFNGQIVQALLQKRERASNDWTAHFYLLTQLKISILPHVAGIAALYLFTFLARIKAPLSSDSKNMVLVCLMVACSGIAPMLVSVKQYHHYLIPAVPFLALMFAGLAAGRVKVLLQFSHKISTLMIVSATVICWGVMINKIRHPAPDIMTNNIREMMHYVPKNSTLGICPSLMSNADIHTYFQRYHQLSLSVRIDTARYALSDSSCLGEFSKLDTRQIPLEGNYFLIIKNKGQRFSKKQNGFGMQDTHPLP
ncbi:hypothetical protein DYBT9275_04669 [Dyadobacter sp. CECT 9275]|uniref:Glycosyltransferase RgtA/B/C/D-like domain-containing protein n=1 Tax=Dyadobacter helix TaxID=2822344 RepID=A0A916JEU9_9BACT|nr:glycosyltransferase family 39 protein [Dyadobacter sp. CECT 9275]CAG5010229.1 hypothetical protein DYBT9275_04669 [Dyadobacter sp. CECT 9275]